LTKKYSLFFLESVCEDKEIIEMNIKQTKLNNPDYEGVSPQEAT